jgi:hypothetical protein
VARTDVWKIREAFTQGIRKPAIVAKALESLSIFHSKALFSFVPATAKLLNDAVMGNGLTNERVGVRLVAWLRLYRIAKLTRFSADAFESPQV